MVDDKDMLQPEQGSKPDSELSFKDELFAALQDAKTQAETVMDENEADLENNDKETELELERDAPDTAQEAESKASDEEPAEDEAEQEDAGIYDNLFEDDWEMVMVEKQAADEKAAKKAKLKKQSKERQKEYARQREIERLNNKYRAKLDEEERLREEREHSETPKPPVYAPAATETTSSDGQTDTPSFADAYTKEYANKQKSETEKRRREEVEKREAEIRQREMARHEENLQAMHRIKEREEASLGKVGKQSHLDMRDGANNMEDYSDRFQNPPHESSAANQVSPAIGDSHQTAGAANPDIVSSHAPGKAAQSEEFAPRTERSDILRPDTSEYSYYPSSALGKHTEYNYTPNGVEKVEKTYSNDGGLAPRQNIYNRDARENRALDTGYAKASYTLDGVAIHADVTGKQGTGVPDRPVIAVKTADTVAHREPIIEEAKKVSVTPTFAEQEKKREARIDMHSESEKAKPDITAKYVTLNTAKRNPIIQSSEKDGNLSVDGATTRKAVTYAVRLKRLDASGNIPDDIPGKKSGSKSAEMEQITDRTNPEPRLHVKEQPKKAQTEKKETDSRLGGMTGISSSANDTTTRQNTAKYTYYKARYGGKALTVAGRAACLAGATVMAIAIEGERANGTDVMRKVSDESRTALLGAYYMMRSNGNQLVSQGTHGAVKTVKELKELDKKSHDALKTLRQERNQLIGSINRGLRVSGNVGVELRSINDVDRMLARIDITPETRQKLNDLRTNMVTTTTTNTWLENNALALNGQIKREALNKLGVKSVNELDIKKINKLLDALNKDSARLNSLLAKNQEADMAVTIKNNLAANEKARNLLTDRKLVMQGKRNNQLRKMGGKMLRRNFNNKLVRFLNDTDVDGFHAIAGSLSTVRQARDAVFIAKNTARATKYVAGKTADAGKKAINYAKRTALKRNTSVGRDIVDKQINGMLSDRFKPKPKPVKKASPRMLDTKADMAKRTKNAKKAVEGTRKIGAKVANAASRLVAGVKTAVATVGKAVGAVASGIGGIAALGAGGIAFLFFAAAAIVIMLILILFSTFATDDEADIQRIVDKINTNRDEVVLDSIYDAFRGETDPFGHPYGYTTLDGKHSDNMLSGVTWEYADGVSNNTAEIISLAAVYYQQDWPSSNEIVNMFSSDDKAFFTFCRDLSGYALDVTAKESHPYSCLIKGGCVLGYRDNGQKIEIKDYRLNVTNHHCSEGNRDCGYYDWWHEWKWASEHGPNNTITEKTVEEDGTHDVYVYFPNKLPDGAKQSELTELPDEYTVITDGAEIDAASVHGNLVFDASTLNIYKGDVDDWFYEPGELTGSFTVVTHLDDENERRDTYAVTFGGDGDSTTAIPWCPGELNDSLHGHYNLNCTVYLTGYDQYEEPCLKPDDPENDDVPEDEDGVKGGTGTLEPLAQEINDGQLTRTVQKLNQWMMPYAGGTAARFTATVTLPAGDEGFTYWYDADGKDSDGNVAWAKMLYAQDWEDLYGVTQGIKCRSFGTKMSEAEYEDLIANMDFGDITDARQKVIEVAIKSSGQFSYSLGSKPVGGPGNVKVKGSYDCSGFVRYCYWMAGLSFDAVNTYDYAGAGDLVQISPSEMQPGDLQVMTAGGGVGMGHCRMLVGTSGGKLLWAECVGGKGSLTNTWTNQQAGMTNCKYYRYTGF